VWRRVAAAAAAIAIALAATAQAGAPDLFDEIYKRGQPLEKSLKTIRAHFTETTTSSLLTKPLVAEGEVLAVRPSDILLTYTKPERKLLRIDATTLLFVWPDRRLREARDIRESQARVQKYFIDKSPDDLRRVFTITTTEEKAPTGGPAWRVELVPKRKQIQQGVTRIELWIDQATSMLSTMTMTFAGGDTKTMTFTHVEINPPITVADLGVPTAD
jgi:outer membrane lipoprotein-sorting protein